jgi:hypothetical protein
MWYELNPETQVRPHLAVICTAAALVAATCLAWLVTGVHVVPAAERMQSLGEWPIVFTLPPDVSWVRSSDRLPDEASQDGMQGSAAYVGKSPEQRDSILLVQYAVLPEGTTVDEAVLELTGRKVGDAEKIRMGPLTGAIVESRRSRGSMSLLSIACSDRGLAIIIEYATLDRDSRARLAFEAVCRSIQYKDWSIKRRKQVFLPVNEFDVSTVGELLDDNGS